METLDRIKKNNTTPFIKEVVEGALNANKGVLQHQSTLWKHLSTQKVPAEDFYDSFTDSTKTTKVKCEPHCLVDFRATNELGVFQEYQNYFHESIEWILATNDSRESNFPHQKQPRIDYWVYLNRAMGLEPKCIYQDEKSGMDIVNHSTRGSIGLLTYDQNGHNMQVTKEPIELANLIVYNAKRIKMISMGLKADGCFETFGKVLEKATSISDNMQGKSFEDFTQLHNKLQSLLWTELQCHPLYPRSVSFVFIKQVIDKPMTAREEIFSRVFQSHLGDKIYDLDKKQDFNDIFKAMILAGKTIDPQFIKKLHYLHHNGIALHTNFLSIIAELFKHGVY